MAENTDKDPNEDIIREFGDPSKADNARLVNLTEAANKGYDEPLPFKITNTGK